MANHMAEVAKMLGVELGGKFTIEDSVGNCYRTYEEAKKNKDKWVVFYASDEVMEV